MNWVLFREEEFYKAQIIKSKLESEDIPVRIETESVGRMYGLTLDGLGGARLYVPQDVKDKAEEILQEPKGEEHA